MTRPLEYQEFRDTKQDKAAQIDAGGAVTQQDLLTGHTQSHCGISR